MRSGLDKVFEHLQSSLSGAKRVRARIIRQRLRKKVSITRALPVDLRKKKPPQVAPATLQDTNKLAPYVQTTVQPIPPSVKARLQKRIQLASNARSLCRIYKQSQEQTNDRRC